MGVRIPSITVQEWQSDLAAMKRYGTRLKLTCWADACGLTGEADLDWLIEKLGGADMTVWDCRPPCPLCGRDMLFIASPGPGTPFRPLTSPISDNIRPLPAQAWMAGWFGRR